MAMPDALAQANITRLVPGNHEVSLTGLTNPTEWGAWAHRGHRLWASMSEEFWMHVYKVQRCPRSSSHDWTSCPYAHKGERARRRDPRRFAYVAVTCPDYRPSQPGAAPSCMHGLRCRYAHGVFELWLHPNRFRTRMCSAGLRCPRRICFFAHCSAELRDDPNSIASTILTPPPPPRVLKRVVDNSTVSTMRDQLDLIEEAVRNRLHLYSNADASSSSSSTIVGTSTPGLTLANDGEGLVGRRCNCRRCVEEEDSLLYPHYDLIMDLVNEE
uniref:C3H1-type domain-containing protein n=1 Tax=Leersia perrieri TaxID=77586 RepID=A0A0D9X2P6_9ORYZ